MVCLYCSGATCVINSRHQKLLNQVWRRRLCKSCGAIFTSHEVINLSDNIVVKTSDGTILPFKRDKLYISILSSCGHRDSALDEVGDITQTIIGNFIPKSHNGTILAADIAFQSYKTLRYFDNAAAVHYDAHHPEYDLSV